MAFFDAQNFGTIGGGLGGLMSLGGSIFGAIEGSSAASKINQDYDAILQTQQQENAVRRQQMELTTRRQMTQNIRNSQMARSMAVTEAVGSRGGGGLQGSGLAGAEAGISGSANTNALGLSQNMQFGEQMFNLNDILAGQQKYLAQDQSALQGIQGLTGMFNSIGSSLGGIGKLAGLAFA